MSQKSRLSERVAEIDPHHYDELRAEEPLTLTQFIAEQRADFDRALKNFKSLWRQRQMIEGKESFPAVMGRECWEEQLAIAMEN